MNEKKIDFLGRIKTDVLYQPYLAKINSLLSNCKDRGQIYIATSGLRTFEEQDKLYAQGRTAPGRIVTKAKGGFSPHNYGCSIDFAPHKGSTYEGKLIPDYDTPHIYDILGQEANKLGLEWGGDWISIKDTPHVQLPLKKHGITWAKLREIYVKGGYPAVWQFLDQYQW